MKIELPAHRRLGSAAVSKRRIVKTDKRHSDKRQSLIDQIIARAYMPEVIKTVENTTGDLASSLELERATYWKFTKDSSSEIYQVRQKMLETIKPKGFR